MNFEEISRKLKKFSKDTMTEMQKMNEVRQLNARINDEKKKITRTYTEMGKKVYELYKDTPLGGFEADMEAIEECVRMMDLLQDQIREIKGVVLCPCCNMEVSMTERFCSNCGNKMPETIKIVEAADSVIETVKETADSVIEAAEAAAEVEIEEVEAATDSVIEATKEAAEAEIEKAEETADSVIETAEEAKAVIEEAAEAEIEEAEAVTDSVIEAAEAEIEEAEEAADLVIEAAEVAMEVKIEEAEETADSVIEIAEEAEDVSEAVNEEA